jgi:hypothetical protein
MFHNDGVEPSPGARGRRAESAICVDVLALTCPQIEGSRRPDPRGERDQQVAALLILDLAHDDALQVSSATSLADIRLPCLPRDHVEQGHLQPDYLALIGSIRQLVAAR